MSRKATLAPCLANCSTIFSFFFSFPFFSSSFLIFFLSSSFSFFSFFFFFFFFSIFLFFFFFFFFSSRRRHTRSDRDWSSDVCSSDLLPRGKQRRRLQDGMAGAGPGRRAAAE